MESKWNIYLYIYIYIYICIICNHSLCGFMAIPQGKTKPCLGVSLAVSTQDHLPSAQKMCQAMRLRSAESLDEWWNQPSSAKNFFGPGIQELKKKTGTVCFNTTSWILSWICCRRLLLFLVLFALVLLLPNKGPKKNKTRKQAKRTKTQQLTRCPDFVICKKDQSKRNPLCMTLLVYKNVPQETEVIPNKITF